MTETKTKPAVKEVENKAQDAQKAIQDSAEKATHAVDEVFKKLKTHFETKKVDEWQKKWLAMPANRKKYEKIADAPEVVGEELVAVTNDIIDFIQGQEAGQSNMIKRLKGKFQAFFNHPVNSAKKEVKKEAPAVKETVEKPKNGNGKAKKPATKPTKR
jgi:hypothetical protein